MSHKVSIVKVVDFDPDKITMKKDMETGNVKVLYDKKPFFLQTEALECVHGINHTYGTSYGVAELLINEGSNTYNVLSALDQVARVIGAKRSEELFGIAMPADKIPYWQIISADKSLKLIISYANEMPCIPIFSHIGKKIESPAEINNRFTAVYLIKFSGVEIDNSTAGSFLKWNKSVLQIKIEESSRLPNGCLITDDEEEVLIELKKRNKRVVQCIIEPQEYEVENELID